MGCFEWERKYSALDTTPHRFGFVYQSVHKLSVRQMIVSDVDYTSKISSTMHQFTCNDITVIVD